jgi:PAS domain S-box-containing protein
MPRLASLLLASFLWAMAGMGNPLAEPVMPTIVILDSYHEGEAWSDNETAGILPALQARYPHLIPSIEHLDTKRFPTPEHLALMKDYLARKYRDRSLDMLMVLDNPALDLMLHPDSAELFPGAPIVFAGINGFRSEMIAGRSHITGVVESQDMAGTLKMAMALHPGVRKVLAIHDYTASGLAVRRDMDAVQAQLEGKVDIVFPREGPFEDLARELRAMPADGLVMILTYVTDQSGRTFTREESTRLISSLSPVPVYAMHETRLGYGIAGGMLLEGKEHGAQAANLALRVLAGEAPSRIPVESSRSRPVLDYRTLARFRVPQGLWPSDAVVINQPVSFWREHSTALIPALVITGVLLLFVALLGVALVRMRLAQGLLREKTEELDRYFRSSLDLLCIADTDGYFQRLNPEWERALGYPLAELEGKRFLDFIHPDDLAGTLAAVSQLERQQEILNFENRYRCKDGSYRWIEWRGFSLEKRIYAVARDVTDRKRAEERLRESEERLRSLINATPDVVCFKDGDGRWLEANKADLELFELAGVDYRGKKDSELAGLSEFYREALLTCEASDERTWEARASTRTDETIPLPDGTAKVLDVIKVPLFHSDGKRRGLVVLGRDITERVRQEQEIRLLNRLYAVLGKVSQAVVQATAPEPFLVETCRVIVEEGGLLLAWIGQVEAESKAVVPVATWGASSDYVRGITVYADDRPEGRGPTGTCIREGRPSVHNDFLQSPLTQPWSERARPYGIRAAAGFPIESAGRAWGALTIYSDEIDFFGMEDVKLLEKVAGDIGFALDNLERERQRRLAEEMLRESEERHRALVRTALDGIWWLDMQGRLVRVNDAYCRMSGYSESELLTMSLPDLEALETSDDVAANIRKIVTKGSALFESRHRRKDGSTYDIEVSAQYLPDAGGRIVAFMRDITERKRMEDTLRNSEERYRTIFNHSPLGVMHFDSKGIIRDFNDKFAEIMGAPREEILRFNMLQRLNDQAMLKAVRDALDGKSGYYEGDYLSVTGGKITPMRAFYQLMTGDAGKFLGAVGLFEDITERKKAEEAKDRMEAQLNQAQKMESVGRLAGGVAHDFNNMLSIILGHAEMVLDEIGPGDPFYHDVMEMKNAAQRSADLTRQLLAFARKQAISPKILDLNETASGILKMLRRLIGEDINLVWMPGLDVWPVKIDPSQIDQILANLAVNARDAIGGVGAMTIETANVELNETSCQTHKGLSPGNYVLLAVSDTGAGMDRETVDHIFEPFFTTKEMGKGTGLGLATVYGIVKQNNGFINVYSEPNQGTTIKIYLPRAGVRIDEKPALAGKKNLTGTETVLLVEDEESILSLGKTILERRGYLVLAAHRPDEALRIAESHPGPIHLLITDVVMPGMNGRDLRDKLKALKRGFQCIFMSGYTADVIAHHGVLDEGIDFLQKPFSVKTLAEKVREVLDA